MLLATAHIRREIKDVVESAKREDENLHSCKLTVQACLWQGPGTCIPPPSLHQYGGGQILPKDLTFSSVRLPRPPVAGFVVLNELPFHASCKRTLRSVGGKRGGNDVPEPDAFLHGVTQPAEVPHHGTGPEERRQKRGSKFLLGEADCTGCPTTWQPSGELSSA